MTQSLESMRRRIVAAEDLYAVVRVMKALAAANVRQNEAAVESLAEYKRTVEEGLQIVLRSRPEGLAVEPSTDQRVGLIVFGSDQGMCGAFNEQVADFALKQADALVGAPADRSFLAVGARVVGRLEDAGQTVGGRFPMPSTVSGVTQAVHGVLLEVEALRFRDGIERFVLVHHRPVAPAGSRPRALQILPLDGAWLRQLASRAWDSRTLPAFTMDWRQLFASLVRQHLFVALYRAFAESLASENASRLASMQAAEKNIQDHLGRLALDYHQNRQQSITEELLDIVAGFETLTADSLQRIRAAT